MFTRQRIIRSTEKAFLAVLLSLGVFGPDPAMAGDADKSVFGKRSACRYFFMKFDGNIDEWPDPIKAVTGA